MNYPTRTLLGFTWVGWLNFLVLQWFFVRLDYEIGVSPMEFSVVYPIVPLSGWWWPYVPNKRVMRRIKVRN